MKRLGAKYTTADRCVILLLYVVVVVAAFVVVVVVVVAVVVIVVVAAVVVVVVLVVVVVAVIVVVIVVVVAADAVLLLHLLLLRLKTYVPGYSRRRRATGTPIPLVAGYLRNRKNKCGFFHVNYSARRGGKESLVIRDQFRDVQYTEHRHRARQGSRHAS